MDQNDVEIKQILQKMLSVLKLANSEAITKAKAALLKSETKKKIYDLCDGKHTVGDIATELQTTQPNVSQHLSGLLETGLVLYEEKSGKKYYFKSLE
jgi:DNA-binding transcriptional ArsR family regulator